MRSLIVLGGAALCLTLSSGTAEAQPTVGQPLPVYRYYNVNTGDHVYTANGTEAASLPGRGYSFERVEFLTAPTPGPGLIPVYRLNFGARGHYLTSSADFARRFGALYEGVVGYVSAEPGTNLVPLHDMYNRAADRHFYTIDAAEVESSGAADLGVIGYVVPGH